VRTQQTCERSSIQTAGDGVRRRLDRASLLTEMDVELLSILQPQTGTEDRLQRNAAGSHGHTRVLGRSGLRAIVRERDRLVRKAEITVVSYEEAGEL